MHPLELLKHTELRHVLIATALVSMSWDLQTFVIPVHGTRVGLVGLSDRLRTRQLRAGDLHHPPRHAVAVASISPSGRC